jgi:hypothetical protein
MLQDHEYCGEHAAQCTAHVLEAQVDWAANASALDACLAAAPAAYTAALVFDALHGAPVATGGAPMRARGGGAAASGHYASYTLRLNGTHLPPTRRTLSDVSVGALRLGRTPDADWQRSYLAANIQLAADRALLSLRASEVGHSHGSDGPGVFDLFPSLPEVDVKARLAARWLAIQPFGLMRRLPVAICACVARRSRDLPILPPSVASSKARNTK